MITTNHYRSISVTLDFIVYSDINGKENRIVKYSDRTSNELIITEMSEIPALLKDKLNKDNIDRYEYEIPYLIYSHLHNIDSRIYVVHLDKRSSRRRIPLINKKGSYDLHFTNIISGDNFAVMITRLNLNMAPRISEDHTYYDYELISGMKNNYLTRLNYELNKLVKPKIRNRRHIYETKEETEKEIKEEQPLSDNLYAFKKIIKNNLIPGRNWTKDYVNTMSQEYLYIYYCIIYELLKRTKEYLTSYLTSYLSRMDTYLNRNICEIITGYVIEKSDEPSWTEVQRFCHLIYIK